MPSRSHCHHGNLNTRDLTGIQSRGKVMLNNKTSCFVPQEMPSYNRKDYQNENKTSCFTIMEIILYSGIHAELLLNTASGVMAVASLLESWRAQGTRAEGLAPSPRLLYSR